MLVLIRLYPKGGLDELCKLIDSEKRNLYWEDIEPLYAIRLEGKEYVSILLDVKNIDEVQKIFVKNLMTMASVSTSKSMPIMSPIYFPMPEGHAEDLQRYLMFLRVNPEKYDDVYSKIANDLEYPQDIIVSYLSYSFGDDDMIVSMFARNRESALKFADEVIGNIDGVHAHDISKVVDRIPFLQSEKMEAHIDRFMYSVPAGQKGTMKNPDAYKKYTDEKAPMSVIIRLFAKSDMAKLWQDVETNIPKMESKNLLPLYASEQESKDYITVISEAVNFEVLKDMVVKDLPTLVDVRKTRTIPMMEPTYFLLPKNRPEKLERFLISLRVNPVDIQAVRAKIIDHPFPKNVFLTYLTYTLGEDDILLSILTETETSAQAFVKNVFDNMEGVKSYNISNQLKTKRLTSLEKWNQHQNLYLSSYDMQHMGDMENYDWADDFNTYAAMTGAFKHELD